MTPSRSCFLTLKKQNDDKTISVLWLWDDHSRMRFQINEGGFLPLDPLSPWRQEWLPTWNQKPKVNLSQFKQLHSTRQSDVVIFDLTLKTDLTVSDAKAPQIFIWTADMGCRPPSLVARELAILLKLFLLEFLWAEGALQYLASLWQSTQCNNS